MIWNNRFYFVCGKTGPFLSPPISKECTQKSGMFLQREQKTIFKLTHKTVLKVYCWRVWEEGEAAVRRQAQAWVDSSCSALGKCNRGPSFFLKKPLKLLIKDQYLQRHILTCYLDKLRAIEDTFQDGWSNTSWIHFYLMFVYFWLIWIESSQYFLSVFCLPSLLDYCHFWLE